MVDVSVFPYKQSRWDSKAFKRDLYLNAGATIYKILTRELHSNAAIKGTHRASTGTTGDADNRGAAPDREAASP